MTDDRLTKENTRWWLERRGNVVFLVVQERADTQRGVGYFVYSKMHTKQMIPVLRLELAHRIRRAAVTAALLDPVEDGPA